MAGVKLSIYYFLSVSFMALLEVKGLEFLMTMSNLLRNMVYLARVEALYH